eukprot:scaffold3571_cov176-Amphora_coffeaeformis.AAC.5
MSRQGLYDELLLFFCRIANSCAECRPTSKLLSVKTQVSLGPWKSQQHDHHEELTRLSDEWHLWVCMV